MEFKDTGPGIPEENLEKLFEPFFTTKPVGKGTGLGLAVSHGIIQDHDGKIRVKTKINEGSSFFIRLPAQKGEHMSTGKILVVDDEDIVRTSCSRTLSPEGYGVNFAKNGAEGLKMASEERFKPVLRRSNEFRDS